MTCDLPVADDLDLWDTGDADEVADHGLLAEKFPVAVLFRIRIEGLQCAWSSDIVLPLDDEAEATYLHQSILLFRRQIDIAK